MIPALLALALPVEREPKSYRINPQSLPRPYATESARNSPRVTPRNGAPLFTPPGFTVAAFAEGLDRPRKVTVAPNGDVFVAESYNGRVTVLRDADGDGQAERRSAFATDLRQPYGIAFSPPGPNPRWVTIAHTDAVYRYPYRSGDLRVRGAGQRLMDLPGGGYNQHWTRNVLFRPDGRKMYVTVGSASNASPEPLPRASIIEANPDGSGRQTFASGLRNPVGLAFRPGTTELWSAINERDDLGDGLVPDYATRVQRGGFYGWPYYYIGRNPDPRVSPRPNRPVIVPDVLLEAHCAALGIAFPSGPRFRGTFRNSAYVSMHGSWNRRQPSGYKVVRLPLGANGRATGGYQDFVWGWLTADGRVWGRPVDVTFDRSGALLISDDGSGTVWRVVAKR